MTRRIVIPGLDVQDEVIELPAPAVRHVARVLRLNPGDEILLLDGRGLEAKAQIESATRRHVTVRVLERSTAPQPTTPPLHLIQSMPKGGKLDEIMRRATELGVTSITPVFSKRSIPKPSEEQLSRRMRRWNTITAEASRQCRRAHQPLVDDVTTLEKAMERSAASTLRVILWEGETSTGLADVLASSPLDDGVTLVVGPEGGFAAEEADRAIELEYIAASLGTLVLRVETAAVAACTVVQLFLGGLDPEERGQ